MRGRINKSLFQFHKGAIRTSCNFELGEDPENFNSIKVRLERTWIEQGFTSYEFQFHKGAIRTRKVLGVDVLRIYGFVGAKIQKNLQKNVDA